MNFQQLRIIRETVRRQFNLTEVAHALATSQSGVSKHIKDLEDELGVELFVRRGKRLLDLTDPGREIVGIVERILTDAGNIKRIADQLSKADAGELTIATTHMQARYALPPVIATFRKAFPNVHLVLHQSSPSEIAAMLLDGRADIGIATEAVAALRATRQRCGLLYVGYGRSTETQATYRFFDQARDERQGLRREEVLTPHIECAKARIHQHPVVLRLQDTSELDFNG